MQNLTILYTANMYYLLIILSFIHKNYVFLFIKMSDKNILEFPRTLNWIFVKEVGIILTPNYESMNGGRIWCASSLWIYREVGIISTQNYDSMNGGRIWCTSRLWMSGFRLESLHHQIINLWIEVEIVVPPNYESMNGGWNHCTSRLWMSGCRLESLHHHLWTNE